MIGRYTWRGDCDEALLRFDGTPIVLILPPLFDEANRLRRTLVQVMRGLATRGLGSVLPDLPGTGDSPVASVDARFEDWQSALAALAATLPRPTLTVAVRGGALLDGVGAHRWRLAPETGARLLRDMVRATAMSAGVKTRAIATDQPVRLSGTMLHPELIRALEVATPDEGDVRSLTLGDGPDSLTGSPLWRRAEPGEDVELIAAMVDDIATWAASCAAQ